MTDTANILQYQQGNDVAPPPDGFEQVTNPLNVLLRSASRLAHFTDGVYDLSAESHLTKLLKVFLGDAGVGGVQKAMLLVRLQQTLGGTHFFDLDALYGGIFGVHRSTGEHLPTDPHTDLAPPSMWDEIRISDGSYRSRAGRLTQAIQQGATPNGIEAVAEALTGIEFDLVESWMYPAYKQYTWDNWELGSWDAMEAFTWDQLEYSEAATNELARNVVTLYPHAALSDGERFDLERALDRIKPAGVIIRVFDGPVEQEIRNVSFSAISDSEKWEVRQLVRNNRINGILPYPDQPEDQFIEPPVSAWSNYTGEAWTVLDRNPRALAYYTTAPIDTNELLDVQAIVMPPQAFLQDAGTAQTVSLPEFALKPVQGLYSGRSVSDGIVLANPYSERDNGQTSSMLVDLLDADYTVNQIQSSARKSSRFWTTPIRAADDPASDVLAVRFDELQVVNHISFDYARFPCTLDVQAWDRGIGQWTSVGKVDNREASPYGIGNNIPSDAVHAFHFGSDHWGKASLAFEPRVSQHWRIVCTHKLGKGPVGISGTAIPYPLGIRDFDMGFRVNAVDKVPHVSPMAPVNSGRNIIGLQTNYFLHRARALYVEDDLPTAWISEPQAIRDAVVNLYLKLKTTVGEIVNQIYVDPVHPGAVCNLYYTSNVPSGSLMGIARDDVVTPLDIEGSVNAEPSGVSRGLTLGNGLPAWVDIDLHAVGGDAEQLWLGREYILDDVQRMSVAPRAAHLDVIATGTGQMILLHGTFVTGVTNYTYYVDAVHDGRRTRIVWPTNEIPARGARLRLNAHFTDEYPVLLGQIDDGPIIDSRTQIIPLGVSGLDNGLVFSTYAALTGAGGSFLTTPNTASLAITGDMEIVGRVAPDLVIPAADQTMVSKWNEPSQHGWVVKVATATGRLKLLRSTTGSDTVTAISSAAPPYPNATPYWWKVTFDVNNGAGQNVVTFWTADDAEDEPTVWNQLGTSVTTAGTVATFSSTAPLAIGEVNTVGATGSFVGKVYRIILRNGIDGSKMADFYAEEASGLSWQSSSGETWTLQGTATIVRATGVALPRGVERFGSSLHWHSYARLTLAVNGYGAGPGLAFFFDPDRYALQPISGPSMETNGTFLRFHPNYIGWNGEPVPSLGFVGGLPDTWALAEWTPLGQFVVNKGVITFPDTPAVAFKMEFTNLIVEPYESFIPTNNLVNRIANPAPEAQGWTRTDLEQATISLLSPTRFQDSVPQTNNVDPLTNRVSPTTGIAVIDGTQRDQLAAQLGFGYNMAQWSVSGRSPIQAIAGLHTYIQTEVQGVSRSAFFIGLRTVQLRRKIDRSLGDGKGYDDSFLDVANIDTANTTFEVEPGQMFTPESPASSVLFNPRVASSLPYISRRPIVALQFSTQQTGPVELLPDDEFRDPALISYDFSNVNAWHASGDGIGFWDQGAGAVRISRDPAVLEAFYAPDSPIVHPPVSPVLASGFARTVTLNFNSYGGISSPMVTVSPRGVLYIGTRVAAYNTLQGDLALRLYGNDGTTLLAEKLFRPQVNVPAEVVLPYVLTNTVLDSAIQVRVEQTGPYRDSWLMYSLSAFDTSVLWEFSVDDGASWVPGYTARNLKYGVVQFPYPGTAMRWRVTSYRYNSVIDQLRIRPWYQARLGSEV